MGIRDNVLREIVRGNIRTGDIAHALRCDRSQVVNAVQQLKQRDLVSVVTPGTYVVTELGRAASAAGACAAPNHNTRRNRLPSLRERAWWQLRKDGLVTLGELIKVQADETELAADTNLFRYLRALERAGIVTRLVHPGSRVKRLLVRWRLVIDLGPRAPVWRNAVGAMYDPNSGKVLAVAPVTAAAEGDCND